MRLFCSCNLSLNLLETEFIYILDLWGVFLIEIQEIKAYFSDLDPVQKHEVDHLAFVT